MSMRRAGWVGLLLLVASVALAYNPQRALLENEKNTIEIVKKDGPGVVYVAVETAAKVVRPQLPPGFEDFAPFFRPFIEPPRKGTGSGFVIDKDGYILTNYHVVKGADTIEIRFKGDPKSYKARVVGAVPPMDIALLKVDAPRSKLVPLPLGDSDQVQVGEKAIAIGNPFGLDFTVTEGIVSAIRKNPGVESSLVPYLIQTDAAINPGNSGGPLLNSSGEVIGINSAILTPSGQVGAPQFAGIGFAIPINLAKDYLKQMKAGKTLTAEEIIKTRPRLGVTVLPVSAYPPALKKRFKLPDHGLVIQDVEKGSPAAKAGLKGAKDHVYVYTPNGDVLDFGVGGDVILEADGVPIYSINDLRAVLFKKRAGDAVTLKVWREGRTREVVVRLAVVR